MDFRKKGKGILFNFRVETLTDQRTQAPVEFYRLDIYGEIDGTRECLNVTCGSRALNGVDLSKHIDKPVTFEVTPKPNGSAKLVSIRPAQAAS